MPPNVKVRIEVEGTPEAVAEFQRVTRAGRDMGRSGVAALSPFEASLKSVLKVTKELGGALTVAMAIGKIADEMRDAVAVATKLGVTAERLDVATKSFVPIALEAKTAGVEIDTLEQRMARLAATLVKLKSGDPETTKFFRAIGLSEKDFRGKDLAQSFTVVLNAIGKLPPSYDKAGVAQKIFSKGAQDLIPLANNVARNGIDPLRQRIGELFADRDISRIRETTDQIELLNYAMKGMITSAVSPYLEGRSEDIRSIAAALMDIRDAANDVGSIAGALGTFTHGTVSVLTWVRVWAEKLRQEIRETRIDLQTLVNETKAIARLDFRGMDKAAIVGDVKLRASQLAHRERLKDIWAGESERPARAGQRGSGLDLDWSDLGAGDPAARIREAGQAQLEATRAKNAALEAEAKTDREAGKKSLEEYYGVRRRVIASNLAAELQLLTGQELEAKKITGTAERKAALEAIASKRDEARSKAAQARAELASSYHHDQEQSEQALASQKRQVDARAQQTDQATLEAERARNATLEAEAKRDREAGILSLEGYYRVRRDVIERNLLAEYDLLMAEWDRAQRIADPAEREGALAVLRAKTDEAQAKADKASAELDTEAGGDRARQAADQFRADLEIARAELDRLGRAVGISPEQRKQLELVVETLRRSALAIGPEAVAQAREFGDQVRGLTGEDFGREALQASRQEFISWATSARSSYKSVGDAAVDMVRRITNALADLAAAQAASSIWNWVTHLFGGGKKASAASQMLSVFGWARGGQVHGPGTGATDTIPSMLANDEYVQTAARMREPGALAFMEYFRERGLRPALRWAFDVGPHFAAGGPVAASPQSFPPARFVAPGADFSRQLAEARSASGQDVRDTLEHLAQLTIVLPPGVDAALDGPEGVHKLVRIVHANQRKFNRALGNG